MISQFRSEVIPVAGDAITCEIAKFLVNAMMWIDRSKKLPIEKQRAMFTQFSVTMMGTLKLLGITADEMAQIISAGEVSTDAELRKVCEEADMDIEDMESIMSMMDAAKEFMDSVEKRRGDH